MKSAPFVLFFVILAFALRACAAQKHPSAAADASVAAASAKITAAPVSDANLEKIAQAIQQLLETRMTMQKATDPADQKRLMHMHMLQMQDGMKMMGMMARQAMMMK